MARKAVVIGSGPNGLAAAITLARAGLDVVVHEASDRIGGGMRTEELTLPGFHHDVCSAIHPLGRSSAGFRELELDVDWLESPACVAHPFDDEEAALLVRSIDDTAAGLGADAEAYRSLIGPIAQSWRTVEQVLLAPFPLDSRPPLRLLRELGVARSARTLRAALGPARAVAERAFTTERARGLFAGNAAHSMLPLERRPSAAFALALLVMGHAVGWPFARGGSQSLADALADCLRASGGEIRTSSPIDELPRADVVLCDVSPRELLRLGGARVPDRYARSLRQFRHGPGAFKLDWALAGPIPWRDARCAQAATVHLGGSFGEIVESERGPCERGHIVERPFVLLAQPSLWDDTRAPAGHHTGWAYCHVPNGSTVDMTDAMEAQVERFAPGFRELVLARSAMGPADLAAHNRNLVGGDLNGGLMDLRQLYTRPVVSRVPYRTPIPGVYLCSASTPPGGGVHGMCGFAAAKVALGDIGVR
ncbi:MAG: Phytoene dehydrogenase-related protein [Actinomycetia bacterium]|nr:Phytoene dehydrogenase-related protein [Actinomycetes bacterium]